MSHLLQLVLALGLGLLAAGLNWIYLSMQAQPPRYVAVTADLQPGDTIEDRHLVGVPVPGDSRLLSKSLIPFTSRALLLGATAPRRFESGDMVFSRDVIPPQGEPQWDVIGPFELISVGERFKERFSRDDPSLATTRGNTVTIAVAAEFDAATSRLLEVVAGGERNRGGAEQAGRIVAVQILPSSALVAPEGAGVPGSIQTSAKAIPAALGSAGEGPVVYQTVSLEGVASVPNVLLEGDFVRFVVPRTLRF